MTEEGSNQVDFGEDNFHGRSQKLVTFVKNELGENTPRKRTYYTGGYYPVYGTSPEIYLPFLCDSFDKIADMVDDPRFGKPVMLEAGSGDGVVAATASLSGRFEHVYGVEVIDDMHRFANSTLAVLEKRNIVPKGNVTLLSGSYYQADNWQKMKKDWLEKNESRIKDDSRLVSRIGAAISLGMEADSINVPTENEIRSHLDFLDKKVGTLQKEGLIGEDGKLDIDVLFWYPSDPFFMTGIRQWSDIMRPGSLIVLASNAQVSELLGDDVFNESFELLDDSLSVGGHNVEIMKLHVYKKN